MVERETVCEKLWLSLVESVGDGDWPVAVGVGENDKLCTRDPVVVWLRVGVDVGLGRGLNDSVGVWLGEVPEGVSCVPDLESVAVLLDGDRVVGVKVLQVGVTVEHVWLWETVRLPREYVRVTVGGVGVGVPGEVTQGWGVERGHKGRGQGRESCRGHCNEWLQYSGIDEP